MIGRWSIALFVVVMTPATALAGWLPGLAATAGGTFAVSGVPDEGGFSFSLSPMWYMGDGISAGFTLGADDLGTRLGRLTDPNDGSDLGATSLGHTWLSNGSFRMDAEWGDITTWMPYASGTWGWYRVINDEGFGGTKVKDRNNLGWSLAAGVRRSVSEAQSLGTSVRYHRVFNDQVGRFVSWSLDWTFR